MAGPQGSADGLGYHQDDSPSFPQAGIGHVNPHRFRHTFAHLWKVQGGFEEDLMRLGDWRDPSMLRRYAVSAARTLTYSASIHTNGYAELSSGRFRHA